MPTTVFDRISGKEFAFSVMVMKHIPIVRTASMLGEEGVKNQMAEVGITGSLGDVEPGLHKLPHRGIENVTFSSDGVPLIPGEDYTVDRGIGWFETTEMFPDFTYTYDTVQISNGFISFIGKGSGLRCGIDFIPMNSDGAQGMLELDEVILTAESARSLIAAGSDPEGVQLNGIIVPRDDGSFGIETDRILDN
ncbi:hypothetical protein [Sulfitobacter guttiformis]|uniref:hypothetical protein n=1 Tax=Sulfitobacter guttiformis TaxID=74349 RepID=UPI000ADF93EC|nr:hypothetical protein [Sulfitobacter guttiformis]KIN72671.1 hypothetical protein Z949_1849 [Sulfitobacter guttiformis KCTC 32187]